MGSFKSKTPGPRAIPLPTSLRSSKTPGRAGPKYHFLCPCASLLPFPLSCHVVSSLCFSMHWLYFPLSAFVYLFLPSVPKSWIQEPAQADDCSGKYRVPKTRSYWPSLGHVAVPGLIYECSRAAGCAPHPHRKGKQCWGCGVGRADTQVVGTAFFPGTPSVGPPGCSFGQEEG